MTSDAPASESFGEGQRKALLGFARASIRSALTGCARPRRLLGPVFESPRGAFVTLRGRADGALRGCIGFVRAERPLADAVAQAAVAAALRDDRFPPVRAEELESLVLEISILGASFRVRFDEVVVGEMGLLVRADGRQGLLLPQVPLEQGWDRDTFLGRTCLKAGLRASAWREPSTEIYGFRCLVFGE